MRRPHWYVLLFVVAAGLLAQNMGLAQAKPKAKELIVGKWQSEDPKFEDQGGLFVEFRKDGTMPMTSAGFYLEGKYKFTADDVVETELEVDQGSGEYVKNKVKVEVAKDSLVTTELGGKKLANRYKRVAAKK
jgi:uncharacterized protein (TIGR03066 family)